MEQNSDALEQRLKELFIDYLNSSPKAFNEIYSSLSPMVLGYLRKRLRKEEDISEVYQGFFSKLHKSRGLYNPSNPILPWIYSILRSQLLDHIKIEKRHQTRVEAFFNEQMSQNAGVVSSNELKESESFMNLLNELHLSPEAINLLKMRFVDDLSTDEMASTLNMKAATLRKRLSRLTGELKEQLRAKRKGDEL